MCTSRVNLKFFGHLIFDSNSSAIMACELRKLKYNIYFQNKLKIQNVGVRLGLMLTILTEIDRDR